MPYLPSIPQPNDKLSKSQSDILNNFSTSDASFGQDHYRFSDATANNGFHNQVTNPLIIGGVHPATDATHTKLYTMQDLAAIGLLQYSRGPNSPVPTPVTCLQSTAAPVTIANNATLDILDFTGVTNALCTIYYAQRSFAVFPATEQMSTTFLYDSTAAPGKFFLSAQLGSSLTRISVTSSGDILKLKNNSVSNPIDVFWTLQFHRITI